MSLNISHTVQQVTYSVNYWQPLKINLIEIEDYSHHSILEVSLIQALSCGAQGLSFITFSGQYKHNHCIETFSAAQNAIVEKVKRKVSTCATILSFSSSVFKIMNGLTGLHILVGGQFRGQFKPGQFNLDLSMPIQLL